MKYIVLSTIFIYLMVHTIYSAASETRKRIKLEQNRVSAALSRQRKKQELSTSIATLAATTQEKQNLETALQAQRMSIETLKGRLAANEFFITELIKGLQTPEETAAMPQEQRSPQQADGVSCQTKTNNIMRITEQALRNNSSSDLFENTYD